METSSRKSLGISPDKVLSDKAVMEYLPGVPMDYVTGPPGNNANEYVIPLGIAFKNYPNHLDLTRIRSSTHILILKLTIYLVLLVKI